MKTIENKSDYETLLKQDRPILLDFYADWCGPCQALLPTVEKLSKEYEGTIEIQKVNVDQNSELAKQFEVRSIPALFFIKDSKVIDKLNGTVPENILREKLEAILN
jgi:thioredoxin